jgi:excisionase family DNA binding protein
MAEETELLTPARVAALAHVHKKTVLRAIAAGELRATRLGERDLRIHPDWYAEWVEARTAGVGGEGARSSEPAPRQRGTGQGRGRLALTTGMGKSA